MLAIDTNVLVRILTNDDATQVQRAQAELDRELDAGRNCLAGNIMLCELVWVLERLYGYSRQQSQQAIAQIIAFPGLRFESMVVLSSAYRVWVRDGGDFADHLLGAQMLALGCEAVLTFDKRAAKSATHRLIP